MRHFLHLMQLVAIKRLHLRGMALVGCKSRWWGPLIAAWPAGPHCPLFFLGSEDTFLLSGGPFRESLRDSGRATEGAKQ